MTHRLKCGLAMLAFLAGCSFGPVPGGSSPEFALTLESEHVVNAGTITDIRWRDSSTLTLSSWRRGPATATLSDDAAEIRWLEGWPPASGVGMSYAHLAVSDDYIATSDVAFQVRWKATDERAPIQQATVEYIADIDVHGDQLLLAGLRRNEQGVLSPERSFAWIGSLSQGLSHLRPVMPFQNRAEVENCAGFNLTSVRFREDGSFVIVPGAEPGVFFFAPDGKLSRTWTTHDLGIDSGCAMEAMQQHFLATDPDARQVWLNRRILVDEVLYLDDTIGLITRSHSDGKTSWGLVVLPEQGAPRRIDLPVVSSSPSAFLSGATLGRQVVLAVSDRVRDQTGTSRILVYRWTR